MVESLSVTIIFVYGLQFGSPECVWKALICLQKWKIHILAMNVKINGKVT